VLSGEFASASASADAYGTMVRKRVKGESGIPIYRETFNIQQRIIKKNMGNR
jgi:hypothetical protein